MQPDTKKRVGILRGGMGEDYGSSLERGGDLFASIYENLSDKYHPVDILVDKDYIWHMSGLPVNPADLYQKADVVWNMSHPSLSNILESLRIPNIGTSGFPFALQNSREMLRKHISQIGLQMPRHIVLPVYQKDFDGPVQKYSIRKAREIFEKFPSPWIVKSFAPVSNTTEAVARTFPELVDFISIFAENKRSILIEEFIGGKVASVHSVPLFRGEKIYVFPLGNIYGNLSVQAGFSSEEKDKLISQAKSLHIHIGAKNYLKSKYLLNSKGKIYLTDIELAPDLREGSEFSEACASVGAKMHHVIEHILELAE